MAAPPSPRRRKQRFLRSGGAPGESLLVVRATPARRAEAVTALAADAELSARVYVVEHLETRRELLFGVSVFAHREGTQRSEVLARFPVAPTFVEASVGLIRSAGFEVLPTGENPEHFDIQLIPGVAEQSLPVSATALVDAAARLLDVMGDLRPNPSYAGAIEQEPERPE
jgi:hypothetical protein